MFVENEVRNATPSIGYAYLTSLVDQSYFNTIFTTNFDDLVNEAFFFYGKQRPIVCAHDSSINSITVTSKRPKIIKLHGDYLFDDIKSTDRETESLGQNMKDKFIEFAKDFGMIIVGYAGGDRSVLDVLSLLLKNEDYFKNGLYWCIRRDSEISEELKRLLWKDRVYFVEIDGFDEFFAEIYSDLNNNECLPLAVTQTNDQHDSIVKKLLANPNSFPETSPILKSAKSRLLRQSKRRDIASLLVNPDEKDRPLSHSEYTDDELLVLTNLERLQRDKKYFEVINQAKKQLSGDNREELRTRVANILINAYIALRQEDEALRVISEMAKQEPTSARWPLRKAKILNQKQLKIAALKEAEECEPDSATVHRSIANCYTEDLVHLIAEVKINSFNQAVTHHKRSLELDPSKNNPSWSQLHNLYKKHENITSKRNELLKGLEEVLGKQGRLEWRLLTLKVEHLDTKSDKSLLAEILGFLDAAKKRTNGEGGIYFERLKLRAYRNVVNHEMVKSTAQTLLSSGKHFNDAGLAIDIAKSFRKIIGDENLAAQVLRENLHNDEFSVDIFSELFDVLLDTNQTTEAQKLIETHKHEIVYSYEINLYRQLHEARGEFSHAIGKLDEEIKLGDPENAGVRSYLLLQQGRHDEAKRICKNYLEKVNYSSEAGVEIVNFELANKLLGQKVDNTRLDKLLKADPSDSTKAAVLALKGHKKDAVVTIKEIFKSDKTFKYEVAKWPVFQEIRTEPEYLALLNR